MHTYVKQPNNTHARTHTRLFVISFFFNATKFEVSVSIILLVFISSHACQQIRIVFTHCLKMVGCRIRLSHVVFGHQYLHKTV